MEITNTPPNSTNVVYLEDCVLGMKRFPDKHFDLAIVDPPYGIGADKKQNAAAMQRINACGKSKAGRGYKLYPDTNWDTEIPSEKYWDELFRVSKNQIVWGGNYFTEYLPPSMGWVMWDKGQRDFSLADGELAWTSFDKALRIFEMSRGEANAKHNEEGGRFHPTQKPVLLYDWLIQKFGAGVSNILDTHVGSGSSRIAAHKAGIAFTGFEIDAEYFQKQERRFQNFAAQNMLF